MRIIQTSALVATAALLIGCGSSSDPKDFLPNPSGKLDKNTTLELSEVLYNTGMDPFSMMSGNSDSRTNRLIAGNPNEEPQCINDGTVNTTLDGQLPVHDDNSTGKFTKHFEYNKCVKVDNGPKLTGKYKLECSWANTPTSFEKKCTESNEGDFVLENTKGDKFTITSLVQNGQYKYEHNDNGGTKTTSKDRTYSAKLEMNNGNIIEFKNMHRKKDKTLTNSSSKGNWELSGAINDHNVTKGWIVIKTDKKFKNVNGCPKEGKITYTGKDNVASNEIKDNKDIVEFNGEKIDTINLPECVSE